MGSSGSGRFRDYPPSKGKEQKEKSGSGEAGGSGGSEREPRSENQCTRDLANVLLEEVGRSAYFQAHNSLPAVGTAVRLRTERVGPRLSVDTAAGESIGFLPTKYNYLVVCMEKGFTYSGEVVNSSQKPAPFVRVNLASHHGR